MKVYLVEEVYGYAGHRTPLELYTRKALAEARAREIQEERSPMGIARYSVTELPLRDDFPATAHFCPKCRGQKWPDEEFCDNCR